MRDVDREAVYAAELAAFDGTDLESPTDLDTLIGLVGTVTAGEWWPGPAIAVRAARRDASSSRTRCALDAVDAVTEIRFARGQLTTATAAHELAHALAGATAGHGARFRSAYLDVIAVVTNLDSFDRRRDLHVRQLRSAFDAAGLSCGDRGWPAPPTATWGPIAL